MKLQSFEFNLSDVIPANVPFTPGFMVFFTIFSRTYEVLNDRTVSSRNYHIIQENEHTHYANCGLHETFGIFGSWYFYEEKGKFYYLTNILLTKLGRFGSVPRYCCFECKGKKESAFFLEELKIT